MTSVNTRDWSFCSSKTRIWPDLELPTYTVPFWARAIPLLPCKPEATTLHPLSTSQYPTEVRANPKNSRYLVCGNLKFTHVTKYRTPFRTCGDLQSRL